MRYVVIGVNDPEYPNYRSGVVDTHTCNYPITMPVSEAEANIIAFALNAVTEGQTLQYFDGDEVAVYEGSTEGVAP